MYGSRDAPRSCDPWQALRPHHLVRRFAAAAANTTATAAAVHELSRNAANSQSRESSSRKWPEARRERTFWTTEIHTFPVSRADIDAVSAILGKGSELRKRHFCRFRDSSLFRDAAFCASVSSQVAKLMENMTVIPVSFFKSLSKKWRQYKYRGL